MKQLIIKRSEWLRGPEFAYESALLRSDDQKKCCLGFYLLSVGLTEDEIRDFKKPHQIGKFIPDEAKWLLKVIGGKVDNSASCCFLMEANDKWPGFLTEEERERKIAEEFLKHGVEVTFVE